MKNRGRGRILMCFKPAFDGDDELSGGQASPPSSGDESGSGRGRKRTRQSFYVAAKAAFFKTFLMRKFRGDKDQLTSSLSSRSKKFIKTMKNFSYRTCWESRDQEIDLRTNSNSSTLFSLDSSQLTTNSSLSSSSSSSSPFSDNLRSGYHGVKQHNHFDLGHNTSSNRRQKSMKRDRAIKACDDNKFNLEKNLFVVSLGALIFWGKVFAILTCTSMWLFFAPNCRCGRQS